MPKYVDVASLRFPNICIFDMKLHGATVPMVRLVDLQELVPAADVVEVVRCKDCKYRFNYGICAYRGDNWFCGYGESKAKRKDGGQDGTA